MKVLTDDFILTESILNKIRLALKGRRVSDVARATGIPRAHLYQMVSNDGNPTLKSLVKVCAALGLKVTVK